MGSLRSALLFAPGAFAFSLGVWQVQRLQQKQTEVAYRKKLLDGEPLHLSSSHNQTEEGARDGALKRHTPVTCRGTFQHERSLYVGPRVRSELGQAFQGYELVTPLVLEEGEDNGGFDKKKGNNDHFGSRWTSFFSRQKGSDKDGDTKQAEALGERERESSGGSASSSGVLQSNQKVVLVLRGWVPQLWRDQPEKFESLMPKDTVQVEGLVKPSDSPGYFAPPNSPEQGQWFYYDLKAMAKACGLISETETTSVPSGDHSPGMDSSSLVMVEEIDLKEEAETKRVKLSTAMDVLAFRTDLGRDKHHSGDLAATPKGVEELERDIRVLMSKLNTQDLPIRKTLGDFLRFKVTPVDHTNYAITWFTLALCTSVMAFARIRSAKYAGAGAGKMRAWNTKFNTKANIRKKISG